MGARDAAVTELLQGGAEAGVQLGGVRGLRVGEVRLGLAELAGLLLELLRLIADVLGLVGDVLARLVDVLHLVADVGALSVDVVTRLFDAVLGLPDAFSRRIARNTQSLLLEESSLGRVLDPDRQDPGAGGLEPGVSRPEVNAEAFLEEGRQGRVDRHFRQYSGR